MPRGEFDDPWFDGAREPFCRRAAWAWLIEHVAYQEHEIVVAGKPRLIVPGQLYISMRELARKWGWAEPKVRRFLQATHARRTCECVTDAHGCLITLCHYERFQLAPCVGDAPTDARATRTPMHSKNQINKGNK